MKGAAGSFDYKGFTILVISIHAPMKGAAWSKEVDAWTI